MRIVLHDFSGHPFQLQLSRELARRGHTVYHLYSNEIVGAKGKVHQGSRDPGNLSIEPVSLGRPINRYNFLRRLFDEREYGSGLSARVAELAPDIVISSNTPLDAQFPLFSLCRRSNIKFVFWLQDILGLAAKTVLSKKMGPVGSLIGGYYMLREKQILRHSDRVIPISDDFVPTLTRWGVPSDRCTVINNWAPLDEMPALPRDNIWNRDHGLSAYKTAIYSGALGLKHNPQLLWDLAKLFAAKGPEYRLVVISEGYGADWLGEKLRNEPLDSLILLPFQPFEQLPQVLASADILLAILEPEAGEFCVPSKVLSYTCVGRPIALAAASGNLASRLVNDNHCGMVVDPKDSVTFGLAVTSLLDDPMSSGEMGENGRSYAVKHFDIRTIGDKFESILESLL